MLALFSLASLRKNEDPISTSQTSAIPLKQKIEETKDGVKGAPSPSMSFYGSRQILTSSPVEQETGEEEKPAAKDATAKEEQSPVVSQEEDSWETDSGQTPEKVQESTKKAVVDEDSWWSEEEPQAPPSDSQSGGRL